VFLNGLGSDFLLGLAEKVHIKDELRIGLRESLLGVVLDVDNGLIVGEHITQVGGLLLLCEQLLRKLG
jgi:hypothetical protein